MKKTLFLASMLSAFMFASCVKDAEVSGGIGEEPNTPGNFSLVVELPDATTKNTVEDSGDHSVGVLPGEAQVNSLTMFLYDADTEVLEKMIALKGIKKVASSDPNIIRYVADNEFVDPGKYNLFVIANGTPMTTANIGTQSQFLNMVDKQTYDKAYFNTINAMPNNGIMMVSRGSEHIDLEVEVATTAKPATVVSVELERALAKVQIDQTKNEYELTVPNTTDVYATIQPDEYLPVNLAKEFYPLRHVAQLTSFQAPTEYVAPTHFGDIANGNGYLIDPYFFKKDAATIGSFSNADGFFMNAVVDNVVANGVWKTINRAGTNSYFYCLENAVYKDAQLSGYVTGLVIKAVLNIKGGVIIEDGSTIQNETDPVFYFNYKFYNGVDAIRKNAINNLPVSITDNSTNEELAAYNITRFSKTNGDYLCYYNYWIKHYDNGSPIDMGVMEYSIVRNNIYDIMITGVSGLGTGDPFIDPEQPVEEEGILDVDFSIKEWVNRKQGVELE